MKLKALSMFLFVFLLLAGCGNGQTTDPGAGTVDAAAALSDRDLADCRTVFARGEPATSDEHATLVLDPTLSVAAHEPGLSAEFQAELQRLSTIDGSLDIIAVDGAGAAPRVVARGLPLSTSGERDRPSVAAVASHIAACVQALYVEGLAPTKAGTDLYRALAAAAELLDQNSSLWVESDFAANVGALRFTRRMLGMTPAKAATVAAKRAPLKLRGTAVHISGVANSVQALQPADRQWLRTTAVQLCHRWRGSGCDGIKLVPANPTPVAGSKSLPKDPPLPFPSVSQTSTSASCTYVLPAAATFAGDSSRLLPAARRMLAAPLAQLRAQPHASAVIVGHTASSSEYTAAGLRQLSLDRARAVAEYLQQEGVSRSQLTVRGVGDTRPLAEDLDANGAQIPAAAAAERRVDIQIRGVPCP